MSAIQDLLTSYQLQYQSLCWCDNEENLDYHDCLLHTILTDVLLPPAEIKKHKIVSLAFKATLNLENFHFTLKASASNFV